LYSRTTLEHAVKQLVAAVLVGMNPKRHKERHMEEDTVNAANFYPTVV
jgi:hypothetical protein